MQRGDLHLAWRLGSEVASNLAPGCRDRWCCAGFRRGRLWGFQLEEELSSRNFRHASSPPGEPGRTMASRGKVKGGTGPIPS